MSGGIGHIAVIGAGAFGTALALAAERAPSPAREVSLWARDPGQAAAIRATGENALHLPGIAIPPVIDVTSKLSAIETADIIILAVPSQATRAALAVTGPHIRSGAAILACAKGIEIGTARLQTEIIAEFHPDTPVAALSGPGFAADIARRLPTAMTVAADGSALAEALCSALSSDSFRLYASDDPLGVQLGGAVKNVLAIACGVVAGLGMGESARAALIARGLAEMTRLGTAMGARAETFAGLSGLGDLVLTATSGQSRNARFGAALAQGRTAAELIAAGAPLAEGAHSAATTAALARRHGVDAPIVSAVAAVIAGDITVAEAIENLVRRPLKRETG